eukprot:gene25838-34426_t
MPSRHSKNTGDQHHFSYQEKVMAGYGSVTQRIGTDSQLPFGYCCLSMHPADEGAGAVVSPSGHIYSKEAIFEYLLKKSKEIKEMEAIFNEQEEKADRVRAIEASKSARQLQDSFIESHEGVETIVARKDDRPRAAAADPADPLTKRRKLIDDTDASVKLRELSKVSPWVPQFTPHCSSAAPVSRPPQRPASPFSGRPLRSKDLLLLPLAREASSSSGSSLVRFVCPVSRKTITTQKVLMLKSTGALMLETAFKELALPSKRCPLTGRSFKDGDVLELVAAGSGFAASGSVEVKKHRPSFN